MKQFQSNTSSRELNEKFTQESHVHQQKKEDEMTPEMRKGGDEGYIL